jgi:nucleoside-diphosphate-sugar epimerase
MKVFVAGATGVIGWRAVERLVAAGHEVTGVARSAEKAELLRGVGSTPVRLDLFDPAAVKEAVVGHDVVVNLTTHIPPLSRMAITRAWAENDRIRTEISRNLADAALAAGAGRYIQESIAFLYRDRGDEWIDEDTPIDSPDYAASVAVAESQGARFTEAGGVGVVLRFGQFYGHDAGHTVDMVRFARRRISPSLGPSDAYWPQIHLDDAGSAVVAALDAPAGTYNVIEDEPATRRESGAALAAALGVKPPRHVPAAVSRFGGSKAAMMGRSERVSNQRFKAATDWKPAYPSVREGWPQVVGAMPDERPDSRGRWARVLLAILAFTSIELGLWAQLAPKSFYESFPGGGRSWVSADGPYNEHLVRDFGGLNLALAVVLVVAAVKLTPLLARTAAVAALFFYVPHLVYHASNLDVYDTGDQIANMVTLVLSVAMPVAVLLLMRGPIASRQ